MLLSVFAVKRLYKRASDRLVGSRGGGPGAGRDTSTPGLGSSRRTSGRLAARSREASPVPGQSGAERASSIPGPAPSHTAGRSPKGSLVPGASGVGQTASDRGRGRGRARGKRLPIAAGPGQKTIHDFYAALPDAETGSEISDNELEDPLPFPENRNTASVFFQHPVEEP